jgi:hypothetical protein
MPGKADEAMAARSPGCARAPKATSATGIFPLAGYRASSGRYGIGGDSHVSGDPAEELRLLECLQRQFCRCARHLPRCALRVIRRLD